MQIRVRPEAGIKVSAIENLQSDIALSLKAKGLRIVAPIPGTDCIGIQIPNPQPQMVRLSTMLGSDKFLGAMNDNWTNLALGKNVSGEVVVKSLEAMPHLLVAGATGSGKSVGVNDFILSLMYQNTPSEMKFLMVDPKQVEMELYSGLPYLLAPIITDPDKALRMLKRTVDEMETRYTLLKKNKVKHIDEFNAKQPHNSLYRIVVIIDELADLMMSGNKKEVELCITRIAQKARAVGIHLIVATQRPSVNVITGLIKANMPTRISYGVVSQIDSRTILGIKGAEELVGKGDMLYMDASTKYPERIQCPFVGTEEINHVVKYLQMKYMK
ncbi:MAG: DNA translocase FtsK [Candidatus Peribacteria bacterium]|nr:MAG: DNA translocase FtsK [Candidatus Peribacteria bacterium]